MKYTVIKPIQYSAVTGNRTRKGTRERTLVRHDVGDVVDLDDGLADKFYNRLELRETGGVAATDLVRVVDGSGFHIRDIQAALEADDAVGGPGDAPVVVDAELLDAHVSNAEKLGFKDDGGSGL